jgi:acetyl esterase/lipase
VSADTDQYYERLLALSAQDDQQAASDPELAAGLRPQRNDGFVPPDVQVTDDSMPGPNGPVPVRVYRLHHAKDARPVLVWCHGGAFAFGDIDMPEADSTARVIAAQADAVVVSVDYRRAVHGVHHPVPLDDVVAAWTQVTRMAENLGGSPHRIHLGGASAGANLAAGACLKLRDTGGHLPNSLLLLYPCMHPKLPPASAELAAKLPRLLPYMKYDTETLKTVVENYLGAPADTASGHAMPALADLRGLPRTLLINCEYDDLRASGETFAASLTEAGVDVDQHTAPGVTHGHLNRPYLAEAQRTLADMTRWIKEN